MNSKNKISFEEYKLLATENDVKELKEVYVPKWWANIPIVGCIVYYILMQIALAGIDRGPLRKEITKRHIVYMFSMLIYPFALVCIITPWLIFHILDVSVKKTEEKIANKKV